MINKGTTKLIKEMNKSAVLSTLYAENSISRAQLAKRTKISKSTVSQIVDELIDENLVIEVEVGKSTKKGGRRPIQLKVNPDAANIVGIEISIKQMHCILTDLRANVIAEKIFELNNTEVEYITEIISEFIQDTGKYEKIVGIGIGIPGITDMEKGIVLDAPELKWYRLDIKKALVDRFNKYIFIEDDVNMAVIGEMWFGAGNKFNDFVFISIGNGIGSGIVINKKIHRGSNFSAGEIGYLALDRGALQQNNYTYGQFGYFESMASILSMEHTTKMSYEEVFRKAKEGNILCQDTVDKTLDYLSLGIANIISILNPEALIIGGKMFRENIDLLEIIENRVNRLTPVKSIIIPTDLKDRSGIMGCIATVISNMYGIKLF